MKKYESEKTLHLPSSTRAINTKTANAIGDTIEADDNASRNSLPRVDSMEDAETVVKVGGLGFAGFVKSLAVFGGADHVDPEKVTLCFEDLDETDSMPKSPSPPPAPIIEPSGEELKQEIEEPAAGLVQTVVDSSSDPTDIPTTTASLTRVAQYEFDVCVGSGLSLIHI